MPSGWAPGEAGFGLRFEALALSFQRYERPESGVVSGIPRSLGALPVAWGHGKRLLLPVDDREAFWIGVSSHPDAGYAVSLRMVSEDGSDIDIANGLRNVPPSFRVVGRPSSGHISALSRTGGGIAMAFTYLSVSAQNVLGRGSETIKANIALADYDMFSTETGCPVPDRLDLEAGYKGNLLP